MKTAKKFFAVFLTLCLAAALLPTAAFAQTEGFTGDIYVYNGQYTCWSPTGDVEFDPADGSLVWTDLNAESVITSAGVAINRNMYVLDGTNLYFGDLDLGTGVLYADDLLNLAGGTLKTAAVEAGGAAFINSDTGIFVRGDFTSEYEVYSYGGTLDVGGSIQAPIVYFNSDNSPLFVTVGGDILAYDYDQKGGSVAVTGDITVAYFANEIYPTRDAWESDFFFEMYDSYAHYNFTELHVGGSVTTSGDLYVGCRMLDGIDVYSTFDLAPIVLTVAGDLVSGDLLAIAEGDIDVGGAITSEDAAYILGGNIGAAGITAGYLEMGAAGDYFERNNTILLSVTGNITATYEVTIYGGTVDVGGSIETLAGLRTIYINGGYVEAGDIDSATGVIVGYTEDPNGTNADITLRTGDISGNYLDFNDGTIYADSVTSESHFFLSDDAALFGAVNADGAAPYSESSYDESTGLPALTELSGLIPGGTAYITVYYGENDDEKGFLAAAGADGKVNVWLPAGCTNAIATYAGGHLTAEVSETTGDFAFVIPEDKATEGTSTASIALGVPDEAFNVDGGISPWGYDPFDPAEFTFTSADGAFTGESAGEESFSTGSADYSIVLYRYGQPYAYNYIGGFFAGEYTVFVNTTQVINDTTYICSGTDSFTIKPLTVTVKASDASVSKGNTLPEFGVTVTDNGDGEFAEYLTDSYPGLFFGESYGTTDVTGTYPIYARADCLAYEGVTPTSVEPEDSDEPVFRPYRNPYFVEYAENIAGDFWSYSVNFRLVNGTLTVYTPQSGSGTDYFRITASAGTGGTISPSGSVRVAEKKDKTFTITADDGYYIDDVLVDGVSAGQISEYTFTDVGENHTISAVFAQGSPASRFTDVDGSQWYADSIDFVIRRGLFNGMTPSTFEPNLAISRGMIAQVLYRLAGASDSGAGTEFTDVAGGQWYSDAVAWAANAGIVNGFGDGTFRPNEEVTREQLVAMLYNFAVYMGYDVSVGEDTNILSYSDFSDISEYAIPALQWACGAGIIDGPTVDTLAPLANITRAEAAEIFMNFIQNVVE